MGKLLYDENFRHVSLYATDVKKTFARVRKQQADARAAREAAQAEALADAEANALEAKRKVRALK